MHQYRLLIALLHTVFVLDGERALESMVQALRYRGVAQDVPIVCGQSNFLANVCKVLVITFEGICTGEHVPLVVCTPASSDGITRVGSHNGGH
jgi:hypothetical protein